MKPERRCIQEDPICRRARCTAGLDLHKAYGPRFARIIFHSADELASFGVGVTKVK